MPAQFPTIYAILDPHLVSTPLIQLAETLAKAGVRLMQLRDKQSSTRRLYLQACELAAVLYPQEVRFIVNDRPDIAMMSRADGVHVGQTDLPVEEWAGVTSPQITAIPWVSRAMVSTAC